MARHRGSRLTEDQVRRMVELDRQGQSISAIAKAVGCHRQTVKAYLAGRRGDILAGEVKKQQLTNELEKHLNDLTQFAVSFKSYVIIPSSPKEDRDADTIFKLLLGEDLPQGLDSDSQKARREQRQINRRNRMLLMSLREHTREKGWWVAYEEWQEVWNICRNACQELRGEAYELVQNHINQKPNLKEEIERQSSKGRDEVENIADDVLWEVWSASTRDESVEFRAEEDRVLAYFADGSYRSIGHRLIEVSVSPDMKEVCELAYETLCQSFSDKHIPEMLLRMDEKIEEIDDDLDPFVLRPLLVRTHCGLCPV